MPKPTRVLTGSRVRRAGSLTLAAALVLGGPAPAAAQSTDAPSAAPTVPSPSPAAPSPRAGGVPLAADPWLVASTRAGGIGRDNADQLDRALAPYGTSYARLTADERARIRRAFDDLFPGRSFGRYSLNPPQARAIVYLALGPWERRDWDPGCERARRGGEDPAWCGAALDSLSRDAAWIHRTILELGRPGSHRPRTVELAALQAMAEKARGLAIGAPRCGCTAARADADALLAGTREALDVHRASSMAAWMSLGSDRVQRIARLSDALERTLIGCEGRVRER